MDNTIEHVKKKKTRYFETYINKLLKSSESQTGITSNAKQQVNSAMCILARTLSKIAQNLTEISGKKTLSIKEVENSVLIVLSGDLKVDAIKNAQNSVVKFITEEQEHKHISRQSKAGIIFSPSIAEKFLRNFGINKTMLTKTAPIFLASVLETVCKTLFDKAKKLSSENNRVRITIRDLELTVQKSTSLKRVFSKCGMMFIGGGVLPGIHPALSMKKPKRKRKQGKKHRFRPGIVCLREIRKFQKVSNCLTFPRVPFERLVRQLTQKDVKISKNVFTILQYYIEQFMIDFLKDANLTAIHAGRVKLIPSDILLINSLRRYSTFDPEPYRKKKVEQENIEKTA